MEHEESWDDIYREFDDHCNRAGRSDGDWPSIHDYWERGGRSGRLLFHLLFTKMHAAGDDAMRTHFPKLEHWITASCILDLEQQWELICEELALRFPQGASSQILEHEYFDKFPWLFVRQLDADSDVVFSGARAVGAPSPAICPTTGGLLADVNAPCSRCHCGVHEQFGTFVVGDPIGEGGQATVHRAYSFTLDDLVALKRLHRKHESDSSWQQRSQQLLREGAKARMAKHPHIVPAVDSGCFGETPYIAYSLVTGVTLQQWIEGDMTLPIRRLNYNEAALKVWPIADAIAVAHSSNVIHGDVKPSNVLVDAEEKFLLTDFGLGNVVTPQYTLSNSLASDRLDRTQPDIEAIGRLLNYCVNGRYESALASESSIPIERYIERCFRPICDGGFSSSREAADELSHLTEQRANQSPLQEMEGRLQKYERRQYQLITFIAFVVFLVSCAALALVTRHPMSEVESSSKHQVVSLPSSMPLPPGQFQMANSPVVDSMFEPGWRMVRRDKLHFGELALVAVSHDGKSLGLWNEEDEFAHATPDKDGWFNAYGLTGRYIAESGEIEWRTGRQAELKNMWLSHRSTKLQAAQFHVNGLVDQTALVKLTSTGLEFCKEGAPSEAVVLEPPEFRRGSYFGSSFEIRTTHWIRWNGGDFWSHHSEIPGSDHWPAFQDDKSKASAAIP